MASRQVRGADGRLWTIRERWLPPLKGLPGDSDLDDLEDAALLTPFPVSAGIGLAISIVVAMVTFPFRLLFALIGQLFHVSFMPPLIEAEHLGPPYSKMTWRAADRQVGPQVIDDIAAALERGDRRIRVERAAFLGFSTRRGAG